MTMHPEKLELKHLCGYLPYGLKIITCNSQGQPSQEWTLNGIRRETVFFKESIYPCDIWHVKPLLIPLSALTKDQWIEVFKAGFDNSNIDHSLQFSDLAVYSDCVNIKYRNAILRYAIQELSFHHWPIKFNQLAAFSKLYELHADLHGLIDAGLALNKLTI